MRESASSLEVEEDDGETVSTTWLRIAVESISIFRSSQQFGVVDISASAI